MTGLTHQDAQKKDDATLRKEARSYLEHTPAVQLVAEVLTKLRTMALPWWSPDGLRIRWSAGDRMNWYSQRPDLRQEITTSLTGLAQRAARRKDPEFQADLIDSVIEDGDIDVVKFEDAFDPTDVAVYGSPAEIWRYLCECWPWDDDDQVQQDLAAWLLRALLADKSGLHGIARKPVLTAWDVRTSIDGSVWHMRMPLEVRVAIDDARLRQEKDRPGEPFHAKSDLAIAVPELIAANVPLRDLLPLLEVAERALGFVQKQAPAPVAKPAAVAAVPVPSPSGTTLPSADSAVKTVPNPPSAVATPQLPGAVVAPHSGVPATPVSVGAPHGPGSGTSHAPASSHPISTGPQAPGPSPKGEGRAQTPSVRAAADPLATHRSAPPPAQVRPSGAPPPASVRPPSTVTPGSSPSVRPGGAPGSVRPASADHIPSVRPSAPAPQAASPALQRGPSGAAAPTLPGAGADSSDVATPYTGVPALKPPGSTPGRPEDMDDMEQTNPWVVPAWGAEGEPQARDTDPSPHSSDGKPDSVSPSKRRRPR